MPMGECRGVYDHTELRSERIKILRGDFWELRGTLEGIKYRETRHTVYGKNIWSFDLRKHY